MNGFRILFLKRHILSLGRDEKNQCSKGQRTSREDMFHMCVSFVRDLEEQDNLCDLKGNFLEIGQGYPAVVTRSGCEKGGAATAAPLFSIG
jgi:hypothetical protein